MGQVCNEVRPECRVMFDGIGRDLRDIKALVSRMMWWLVGTLTSVLLVVLPLVLTALLMSNDN